MKAHSKAPSTASFGNRRKDQAEIAELFLQIKQTGAKLVKRDGTMESLPNDVSSFLRCLLTALKAADSVTILHSKTELTTLEASKLLGMSRQFLVGLLSRGEIPYHMIGTHRRLYTGDVLAYKVKRDSLRRKALDDLARAEYSEGTYDQIPDDFRAGQ